MLAQQTPVDLAQRLARKARHRTILVVGSVSWPATATRLVPETEVGFGWGDALQAIWEGQYEMPIVVLDLDVDAPSVVDLTESAARQLAQRTFAEGETPRHLRLLFDQFDIQAFEERAGRRDPHDEHRLGAVHLGIGSP